ncbi:hypothetical protein FPQ18DRAFT_301111 [Pyronema domesticum]|uniref:Uncharacterized protein n=1 Tax=Pyronema omphalodes (strain CBS 100304) TaxID=1076935 RepID=U4LPY6_PYROM|nr:hypothetical protein FPQ18DRAFT_301111 [Pyronema domesticum]CCX31385.1 Protein of unknown function [Pyronema omphalodes CBS 100304]
MNPPNAPGPMSLFTKYLEVFLEELGNAEALSEVPHAEHKDESTRQPVTAIMKLQNAPGPMSLFTKYVEAFLEELRNAEALSEVPHDEHDEDKEEDREEFREDISYYPKARRCYGRDLRRRQWVAYVRSTTFEFQLLERQLLFEYEARKAIEEHEAVEKKALDVLAELILMDNELRVVRDIANNEGAYDVKDICKVFDSWEDED